MKRLMLPVSSKIRVLCHVCHLCHRRSFFVRFDGCARLPVKQICQRLLSLSMLAKSMDFKAIFGEVHNILFNKFKLDPQRCRGFMLDGCAANLKALSALTTHCANAVSLRCMSHLFSNSGDKIKSTLIDKFAGALHTVLSHSANASKQWRAATKTPPPPKTPSRRWHLAHDRNDQLVMNWQGMKTFIDDFSSSDETKSAKAKFRREKQPRSARLTCLREMECWWVTVHVLASVLPSPCSPNVSYFLRRGERRPRTTCYFPTISSLHLIPFCPFLFSPPQSPRRSHQLLLAFEAIARVRMGLALTREADGTFGRPQLPNVDALIRVYCQDNVRFIAFWYLWRKSVGWPRGRLSEGTMVL